MDERTNDQSQPAAPGSSEEAWTAPGEAVDEGENDVVVGEVGSAALRPPEEARPADLDALPDVDPAADDGLEGR